MNGGEICALVVKQEIVVPRASLLKYMIKYDKIIVKVLKKIHFAFTPASIRIRCILSSALDQRHGAVLKGGVEVCGGGGV